MWPFLFQCLWIQLDLIHRSSRAHHYQRRDVLGLIIYLGKIGLIKIRCDSNLIENYNMGEIWKKKSLSKK
jgi:hypothetical protein